MVSRQKRPSLKFKKLSKYLAKQISSDFFGKVRHIVTTLGNEY